MPKKLRLGVVGFGRLGTIHSLNISKSKYAELFAVCDISPEARQRADEIFDIKTCADLSSFFALPLDGVIIATSTSEHLRVIAAAAAAGISIFTEKPVGLTLEETDAALKDVLRAGVQFQIGFQRRWDPRYLQAKEIIDRGSIGEPVLIKSFGRDPNASNPANWGLGKNGGLFLNAAIHDYDIARFFFGSEATVITASGAALVFKGLNEVGDIDTCSTTINFNNSQMAITEWSRYATYGYDIGTEIIGTEGAIRISSEMPGKILVRHKNSDAPTLFDVFADAFRAEIEGFIQSLMQGTPTSPGIEDARIALQLALAARESFENVSLQVTVPPLKPLSTQS